MNEKVSSLGPAAIVDDLRVEGMLKYGQTIDVEFFEKRLLRQKDEPFFRVCVSTVRRLLLEEGFYLSGREAGKKNQYRILNANQNVERVAALMKLSKKKADNAMILGSTTDLSQLTLEEKLQHESVTARAAVYVALLKRSEAVAKLVGKYRPELLE